MGDADDSEAVDRAVDLQPHVVAGGDAMRGRHVAADDRLATAKRQQPRLGGERHALRLHQVLEGDRRQTHRHRGVAASVVGSAFEQTHSVVHPIPQAVGLRRRDEGRPPPRMPLNDNFRAAVSLLQAVGIHAGERGSESRGREVKRRRNCDGQHQQCCPQFPFAE